MLEVKHLTVNYDHIEALKDVSFQIQKGDIVSIIGSNGAGKTTLLNTISGLVKKKSGEILLDGAPLPLQPHKVVKKGIVHVPEGRKVFVGLTIEENLIVSGCRVKSSEAKKRIQEMYALFPILEKRKKQMAGTLSGGEQQMLAIARGLVAHPDIILLDEPSLGLAPLVVKQVFELITQIQQMGITVLLVEQNAKKALSISNYTYVLENGAITRQGKSSELIGDPTISKAYLGE